MSWPEYKGKTVGFAKVMGELPVSDGSLAYEIMNFTATEEGFLDNKLANMPLIPKAWNESRDFNYPPEFENVYGMKFIEMHGESPELLILTSAGVFKFSPSLRSSSLSYPRGSSDRYNFTEDDHYASNGLAEQFMFKSKIVKNIEDWPDYMADNVLRRTIVTVKPQSVLKFPAQIEVVGNRVYFTFCDGGGAYVWDGYRIREFGYQTVPSSPHVLGPASSTKVTKGEKGDDDTTSGWNNGGGFCDGGRIGTLNYDISTIIDDNVVTAGGIEPGLWYYAVAFENQDGSYSKTSVRSSRVTIQHHAANPEGARTKNGLGFLRRRFWVNHIPKGPEGTVARILLRTMNITSLPPGEAGELRFLHRIPNNNAQEYMDDIPDSELGRVWDDRRSVPPGFYFMKFFGGSMFVMRTEDHPSRVWWSEQGTVTGSIPESFMQNHWRDVFPETGPITGSFSTNINGAQTLLVFKDKAVHYISSSYEQPGTSGWSFGTLSTIAGCAGPNLCQSTPDGYTIWYGNGTFWMWGKDTPGVIDIGAPIRKRLSKINEDNERFGVSWVTKKNKELVFCLPYKDSTVPDLQFVWDYRNRGWRLRQDVRATAVETVKGMTLIANKPATPSAYSPNILVYQRGYENQPRYTDNSTSIYTTGWQSFSEFGPEFHSTQRTADSVFTLQERTRFSASVDTYSDWNFDDKINEERLALCNPETISDIPTWSTAQNYDDAVYRTPRTYTHRVPLDIPSCTVFSMSIEATTVSSYMSLISVDAYGPISSNPTSRSPARYEENNDAVRTGLISHGVLIVSE